MTGPGTDESSVEAPDTDARHLRIQGSLRRLLYWTLPGNLGHFLLAGAVPTVLLPLQVAGIDEADKVANLALVTTVGAVAAMVTQPVAGVLSDRTRSRFGRRSPWMVAGAVAGLLAMIGLAASDAIVGLVIAWACAQIAYNSLQAPATAILPDRVPAPARGRFATMFGLATTLGALLGQTSGALFARSVGTGYVVLGGVTVVLVVAFVVANPDTPSGEMVVPRLGVVAVLRSFWVNPVRHPDFCWVFVGRLFLYTAYFSVTGYLLFLLQDYIGVGSRAPTLIPLLSLAALVGMLPAIAVAGPLSDRLGRRKPFVAASSALIAVAVVFPWVSPSLAGMIAMAVTAGVGFGIYQAVDTALMTEVLPDTSSAGKDLGLVNIAGALPQALAPAVGGAVVLATSYAGLFPVAMVLSLLGAGAVLLVRTVR